MIKLTSKGPILFKQQRLGQYGVRFTFLKFRSMYFQNDAKIHQDYVRQLISAKDSNGQTDELRRGLQNKGRSSRNTGREVSPQNQPGRASPISQCAWGEMSLVGPRPPIPYEVEAYDIWHRRRFLEIKPGITGLWQVEGRSRVKFDEMVRLDIKYAKTWSPWLDIKILLRTPRAVLRGDGAY